MRLSYVRLHLVPVDRASDGVDGHKPFHTQPAQMQQSIRRASMHMCSFDSALHTPFSAAQSESAICPELSVLEQLVPAIQEHTLAIPHAFLKQPRKEKAAIKPLLVPN